MKCYKCGSFLYESDYCAECGANVATYKRIIKKSNELYNRGLEMARDRNLSGAIECLQISLKMYKANINARNLLGLIYVEIGEYTMGLAQWVVSKSIQSENNMADHFLDKLQNNRQDLNLMKSTIRKYNKAIGYINQGNYDLAEIQLKKLLNDNGNLVKGHQLLALLFIRKKKYAEARNALRKARKIDQGNTRTISYMALVEEEIKEEESDLSPTELRNKRLADRANAADKTPLSGDDVIIPKSSYHEYNSAAMTIIKIIIGVVIGAAVIFFVVTPAKTKSVRSEYNAQISDLNSRVETLQKQLEEAQAEQETETEPVTEDTSKESYVNIVNAQIYLNNKDYTAADEALGKVDTSVLDENQKSLYDSIANTVKEQVYADQITSGTAQYESEDYAGAAQTFQTLYDNGLKNSDVLFYLGMSYNYNGDTENALKYLREYASSFPEGESIDTVQNVIDSLA